ncbi:MAG: insulinase family protein, partial [Lentisphaerae bacterium]|nr:insulinase family protein [Lentisphaerota bacterium]
VVALAGRVSHDDCVKNVRRLTRRLKQGRARGFRPVTRRVGQERAVFEQRAIEQAHLALAFRVFGRRDRRRYALKVLSAVLGENMSSRLFQIVREKHGLAYSVHSSVDMFADAGALIVSAGVDRERRNKALKLILRELVRIRDRRIGIRELERAKDYIVGQTRLGLESTSQQMMWAGNNVIFYGRFISPADVVARVQRVSSADVQNVAQTVIQERKATLAMIGPDLGEDDQAECRAMLTRL